MGLLHPWPLLSARTEWSVAKYAAAQQAIEGGFRRICQKNLKKLYAATLFNNWAITTGLHVTTAPLVALQKSNHAVCFCFEHCHIVSISKMMNTVTRTARAVSSKTTSSAAARSMSSVASWTSNAPNLKVCMPRFKFRTHLGRSQSQRELCTLKLSAVL